MTSKRKVCKLHRMNPSALQQGYWYFTPEAYCVGPFQTEKEREEQIAIMYEEVEPKPFDAELE